jgi:hypothetical protein
MIDRMIFFYKALYEILIITSPLGRGILKQYFFYTLLVIFLCPLLSSCGFKSEPELAASRLQYSKNKCPELYITDNYATSTNNSITAKQVYKIEAKSPDDARYKPDNAYPVYHSFINNANLVGNIMVNKNIRNKACQDYYLTNIKYFEK